MASEYRKTKEALCTSQESGNHQLSLDTMLSVISIYSNECYSVGTYAMDPESLNDGCALPLKIWHFGEDKLITIMRLDLSAVDGADAEGLNDEVSKPRRKTSGCVSVGIATQIVIAV